eukprot:5485619-Ditylum_brightwellii.AAC.1
MKNSGLKVFVKIVSVAGRGEFSSRVEGAPSEKGASYVVDIDPSEKGAFDGACISPSEEGATSELPPSGVEASECSPSGAEASEFSPSGVEASGSTRDGTGGTCSLEQDIEEEGDKGTSHSGDSESSKRGLPSSSYFMMKYLMKQFWTRAS